MPSFNEYIKNPAGHRNAVYSNRDMYRELYRKKLDLILLREANKIDIEKFVDTKKDKYIIWIKVPSEVIDKFYYDTVVEFTPTRDSKKDTKSIVDYNVRFYSNDPSFAYTFCYALNKHDMFISDLENKMPKEFLNKKAVEKNPKAEVGYVKSIYFAYLIMADKKLFNKALWYDAKEFNKRSLSGIMNAGDKIALRQEKDAELRKSKTVEKKKEANRTKPVEKRTTASTDNRINAVKVTPVVGTKKKSGANSKNSNVKITKTSKKI